MLWLQKCIDCFSYCRTVEIQKINCKLKGNLSCNGKNLGMQICKIVHSFEYIHVMIEAD